MALLMLVTFATMSAFLFGRGVTGPASLMLACVLLNAAGVATQMRKLTPHPRFNHNDLFHAFQLAALSCLFAAVRAVG